jgi:hypothetical protein
MPLKKGTSRVTISSNVKELVDEWKEVGRIGASHPRTKKAAVRQAVAIALDTAGVSRRRRGQRS